MFAPYSFDYVVSPEQKSIMPIEELRSEELLPAGQRQAEGRMAFRLWKQLGKSQWENMNDTEIAENSSTSGRMPNGFKERASVWGCPQTTLSIVRKSLPVTKMLPKNLKIMYDSEKSVIKNGKSPKSFPFNCSVFRDLET